MTITLGWWLAPVIFTIAALIALVIRLSRGGAWDFGLLFVVPGTGCAILFVWMLYFAIGWANA